MATVAFTYGSTALSTFGKVTQINDYLDIPERRGENQVIPYRHGTVFAKKYFGERKMTFGMAVTAATATALETKFDTMRAKFAPLTEQVLSVTLESGAIRNAYATVDRPIEVDRKTNTLAFVVVEFTLANPIWRLSTAIADNTTVVDESPESMTVTNPGTVEERDPTILLTGSLQNVVITNTSITPNVILTYTGTIAVAHWVSIATATTGEYTAIDNHGVNVIGNVTHSGSSALMVFAVGDNVLSITTDAGPGAVKASFYAPYL